MKNKLNKKIGNTGFVTLIALLLANVFLMIGLSVYSISMKELGLSFGGRESLFAFYAADGGMECALYWDIQKDAFSTSTPLHITPISCAGLDDIEVFYTVDEGEQVSSFDYSFGSLSDSYVEVTVTKTADMKTEIVSRGRNSGDPSDSRRVERAWRVRY